jgi:sensor histidine kinase regulating citrate/malate metabolism
MENADLCALLSNLIENALEACRYFAAEKHIDIVLKIVQSHLVILVENSFDGTFAQKDGVLLSRKRGGTLEGVGTASVRMLAQKYGGTLTYEIKGAVFSATVLV